MYNLNLLPLHDDKTAWRTWLAELDIALDADPMTLEQYVALGRLWRRLIPVVQGFDTTLRDQERRSVVRAPGEAFAQIDADLLELSRRAHRALGRLEKIARETHPGREFPVVISTGPR